MTAYYNENDPKAAAWLCELIKEGHIAPGVVDTRSIEDVRPSELTGFTQCHFFAGIGGWSLALRLAGWPDDRPVWTGSCPCQPFSAAGKRGGTADERHLWPHFHWLIQQQRPITVFGEQVASKDGLAWLDIVQADLENSDYSSGAVDLCAAGFGAPHIRQRLFWVAQSASDRRAGQGQTGQTETRSDAGWLAERQRTDECGEFQTRLEGSGFELLGGLADGLGEGLERLGRDGSESNQPGRDDPKQNRPATEEGSTSGANSTNGFWADADWLGCRDGKWRPVESGTFPLANGVSARVVRLRGYGNAIVPQVAAAFIQASEVL